MSNEILNKLLNEEELTSEEVYYVLQTIMSESREMLKKVPSSNNKKCYALDEIMFTLCYKYKVYYHPLCTKELKNDNLYHKFGLLVFNAGYKPIIYIVDPTYIQFIDQEYINVDDTIKDNSPARYLEENFRKKFFEDGYLKFTKDNFEKYIMSFVKANNNQNAQELLSDKNSDFEKFNIRYNLESDYYNPETIIKEVNK